MRTLLGAQMHETSVHVQQELIQEFGRTVPHTVALGYDVACSCGWVSFYATLPEANEACGRHANGLDPEPAAAQGVSTEEQERRAREEFERVRARMLETGDPFCDE